MCDVDFDESFDATSLTVVRAAKEHRCQACGGLIPPGRKYVRFGFVMGGRGYTEKMCVPCRNLMERFGKEHGFTYTNPSCLKELIESCLDDFDEDSKRWQRDLREMERRGERQERA